MVCDTDIFNFVPSFGREDRMKRAKTYLVLTFVFIVLTFSGSLVFNQTECASDNADWPAYPEHCTTVLVGKDASVDGSVIACQTADCGMCDFTWHYFPAADHTEGSVRKIYHINQIRIWPPEVGGKWVKYVEGYTGVDIPQVPHTYAYQRG
jgi:dipeptidase